MPCAGWAAGPSNVSKPSTLIDSACATNATDSPIKADLIEACPHLWLFLLSTRLLIVTPNRGGPPTKPSTSDSENV